MAAQIDYIAASELLYFLWQSWRIIAISSLCMLILYIVFLVVVVRSRT